MLTYNNSNNNNNKETGNNSVDAPLSVKKSFFPTTILFSNLKLDESLFVRQGALLIYLWGKHDVT